MEDAINRVSAWVVVRRSLTKMVFWGYNEKLIVMVR